MTKHCPNCNQEVEDDAKFCDKCGADIGTPITDKKPQSFTEENKLPLIIIGATALVVILLLAIFPSALPSGPLFELEGEPTQSVDVDGIFIKIPQEFRLDPSSIDFNVDRTVLSSTKGWSHEREYIGLMVMRVPASNNIDYSSALGAAGGVQKNMYGYNGYYTETEDGYGFAFSKDGRLCVIMVSSPYLFDKIKIE